jgi:tRNA nucleotidyltransferase (CCA-adding enzyme)
VTKLNADKSKHLETARVKINSHWIDLVNLRGESYSESSRIPEVNKI